MTYKRHFTIVVINFVRSCCAYVGRAGIIAQRVTFQLCVINLHQNHFPSVSISLGSFFLSLGYMDGGTGFFVFPVDFWFCTGAGHIGLKLNLQLSRVGGDIVTMIMSTLY